MARLLKLLHEIAKPGAQHTARIAAAQYPSEHAASATLQQPAKPAARDALQQSPERSATTGCWLSP